ncbi:MAG: DUF1232 domain-containing protein [Solirubrobacterales bacterium]|nr:DUF1232 domain-containing protein [Solirubrobacterales bacterium]
MVNTGFVGWLLLAGRRQDARALAGFVPDCVVLVRRLLGDDRVPRRSKWLLAALVVYLASPIDLVPDLIPVAGQLDDAILLAVVVRRVLRAAGPGLLREHWPGPESSLEPRAPRLRAYPHTGGPVRVPRPPQPGSLSWVAEGSIPLQASGTPPAGEAAPNQSLRQPFICSISLVCAAMMASASCLVSASAPFSSSTRAIRMAP